MGVTGVSSSVARTIVAESRMRSGRSKRSRALAEGSPPTANKVVSSTADASLTEVLKDGPSARVLSLAVPVSGMSAVT